MSYRNFRIACCEYFGCDEQSYAGKVFWHCLHRRSALSARLLHRFDPAFFEWDFKLINRVGLTTDLQDLNETLNDYLFNTPDSGLLHHTLRIRVSGKQILALGATVFPSGSRYSE